MLPTHATLPAVTATLPNGARVASRHPHGTGHSFVLLITFQKLHGGFAWRVNTARRQHFSIPHRPWQVHPRTPQRPQLARMEQKPPPRAVSPVVSREDAMDLAREVMAAADQTNNLELSVTELTLLLENTPHQEFGQWVKAMQQSGWRDFDEDGSGA